MVVWHAISLKPQALKNQSGPLQSACLLKSLPPGLVYSLCTGKGSQIVNVIKRSCLDQRQILSVRRETSLSRECKIRIVSRAHRP